MDTYIYNTICKSQILETTKMPIDNRMDKTWYIHAINEHFTTTCNNMDLKNNAESQTEEHTICNSIYNRTKTGKTNLWKSEQ